MPKLKNILSIKRKNSSLSKNAKSEDQLSHSSNLSLASLPGSRYGSNPVLANSVESLGGYMLKEKDLSKFLKAAWNGDIAKLKQIASKKVNWNECDKHKRTALHLACSKGYVEVVDFLVTHGANVNLSDSEGKTPLIKACEKNSTSIVECLMNNACETNVFDANQITAFHFAAAHGNIDIGYLLSDNNAKLDPKDGDGVTPLHISCESGHKSFVEFLLSEYVGVDCLDNQKRTPLMAACVAGHADIAQLLIDNKADITLMNKDGKTAQDLTDDNAHTRIADIFDRHKKKSDMASLPISDGAKKSANELFSPTAKTLNEMFSSKSSTPSHVGSIFGGPAVNTDGNTGIDKSEDSKSEELDDHSWADSDDLASSNDFKKPSINITALMKKKESEKGKSKTPDSVSNMSSNSEPGEAASALKSMKSLDDLSKIPKPSGSSPSMSKTKSLNDPYKSPKSTPLGTPSKSASKTPTSSGSENSLFKSSISKDDKSKSKIPRMSKPVENKSSFDEDSDIFSPPDITPKKTMANKLPWQQIGISDDSESEWDDEDANTEAKNFVDKTLEKIITPRVNNDEADEEANDIVKKTVTKITTPRTDDKDSSTKEKIVPEVVIGDEGSSMPTFQAPPPPQFDLSRQSSDFDSSQPNEIDSFSDFPLSDMDGSNRQNIDSEIILASPTHFSDDMEAMDDKSTIRQSTLESKEAKKKSPKPEPIEAKADQGKALKASKTESDWDSDLSLASNMVPNLPPAPPPPANLESDFDLSETDEEPESEFDLEKKTADEGQSPGIFQTEVTTHIDGKIERAMDKENKFQAGDDSEEEGEIEQQMLALVHKTQHPVADVDTSKTKNADDELEAPVAAPFDFGSEISEVSDPEGLCDFKLGSDKVMDDNNNLISETKEVTKSDILNAAGIEVSESTELESESEWEKELLQKRLSAATNRDSDENVAMSDDEADLDVGKVSRKEIVVKADIKKKKSPDIYDHMKLLIKDNIQQDIVLCGESSTLQEEFDRENEIYHQKDKDRLTEFEANRKAHEDLLAAEIADELKKEMMDDIEQELDSSSDFSFTPDFKPSPVMEDDKRLCSSSEKGKVKDVVSPTFQRPDEISYGDSESDYNDEDDDDLEVGEIVSPEIKEKIQILVKTNAIASSPEKLDQLIDKQNHVTDQLKRKFGLEAEQERERIISDATRRKEQMEKEIEIQRELLKLEENRLREEDSRLKKEEKRLKKLEEQERVRNEKIVEDEKRLLLLKEEQEKKQDKEARDRIDALNNMEADLKKRAEEDLQQLLEAEDDHRRKQFIVNEKQLKEEFEKEKSKMMEEFEREKSAIVEEFKVEKSAMKEEFDREKLIMNEEFKNKKMKLKEEHEKEMKLKEELWEKQSLDREIEAQRKLSAMKADKDEVLACQFKGKDEFIQRINELEERIRNEFEHKEKLEDEKKYLEVERERQERLSEEYKVKLEQERALKNELTLIVENEKIKLRRDFEDEFQQKEAKLLVQMKEDEKQLRERLENMEIQCKRLESDIELKEKLLIEETSQLEKQQIKENDEEQAKFEKIADDEKRIMRLKEEQMKEMMEILEKKKELEKMVVNFKDNQSKAKEALKQEMKNKEEVLEQKYADKEKELTQKFAEMKEVQLQDLERQLKVKEDCLLKKVKKLEEEKEREWTEKENIISQQLKTTSRDGSRYTERLKELETRSKELGHKEKELERKTAHMNSLISLKHQEIISENENSICEIKAKKDIIEKEIKRRKEELEKEEGMRLLMVQDESLRKKEYESELSNKEKNRRKLGDEEREFRKKLEDERELKLMDLIKKMELDRVNLQTEFEKELRHKDAELERQMFEKEQILFTKLKEIEERNLKEMEDLAKTKEGKVLEKLRSIEEEKRKEWDKLEENSLEKLEIEGEKHKTKRSLLESEMHKDYERRFQELERDYRRREHELEMQLADLRVQQKQSHKVKVSETCSELKQLDLEADIPDDFEIPDGTVQLSNRTKVPGKNAVHSERGASPVRFNEHIADLQRELHDSKRQAEAYKDKATVLERVGREMQYDMEEMHKMIEVLNHSHKEKDKRTNDVDMELQSAKFRLEKETEEKNIAEKLCKQLRDQLDVIEAKLSSESELRQTLYLENQKYLHHIEAKDQKISNMESEMEGLKVTMENERNARILQEDRYKEKIHEHELVLIEVEKKSNNHAEAVTKLEASDETRKQAESTIQLLHVELAQTKAELSKTQSLLEDYKSSTGDEVIKLRDKMEDKIDKLSAAEKSLFQIQIQYENEKMYRSSLEEKLADKTQSESAVRQQFEEEVTSLKRLLEKSKEDYNHMKDKMTASDHERNSVALKLNNEKTFFERDLLHAKEQLKVAEKKLLDAETQIKTLNEEVRAAGLAVSEKNGDAANVRTVLEETKNNLVQLEGSLREEKMLSNKLESKLETANERINLLQLECDKLTKELLSSKKEYAHRDRSAYEKQDSVNAHITALQEKFSQERTEFILKNEQNNLLIEKIQNEISIIKEKLAEKCKELTQCMQKASEVTKDLTTEKAAKLAVNEEMEKVSRENSGLRNTSEDLRAKVKALTDENNCLQIEVNDLRLELEKSKEVCAEITQKLQKRMTDIENARLENHEIKSNLQEMKKHKFTMEADLREEKARVMNVNEDLQEANRFIDLEKQIEDMKKELDEEKRKARKANDLKKSADEKNEIYEKRSLQHQQEVTALKTKLKQYQRRLKEYDGSDSRIPAIRAEFELERQAMSTNLAKLRRQLDQLSERLTHEQEMRDAEEKKNREQLKELTDLKTNEKVQAYEQERLERKCREFQHELEKQKTYYERNFLPAEELEEFKKALETKARLDLNKKLQEVNMHLEEQSLAREAFDKLRDGIEKKTKTGFEETVTQLKNDLTEVKACLHEGLVKRDTSFMEAQRFKELYESERLASEKLSEQLAKTNERLSLERNRTNYLFDETMNKSKVTKKLFEESLEKDKKKSLSPRLQDEAGISYYRPKLWSTPVGSAPKSPYTSPDPLASIKRRNLLS